MKSRGILFSAPMVRAILSGAKTQTRRVLISEHAEDAAVWADCRDGRWESGIASGASGSFGHGEFVRCPFGISGDRLWVGETHALFMVGEGMDRPVPQCVAYRATCDADGGFDYANGRGEVMRIKVTKWTPSIHMPRWASRITLEITEVRVQRLQEISEDDARAEGVERDTEPCDHTRLSCEEIGCLGPTHRSTFCELWDSINGKRAPWSSNPWCWEITFRRLP